MGRQKGYTLVEILVAMAITAIIGTVITVSLSQTMAVSWSGNKHMVAIKQVENALFYINRDVQAASSISTTASGKWLQIGRADGSYVYYTIVQPGGSQPNYLQRTLNGTNSLVAQYIDTGSSCSYNGNWLEVTLTATLSGLGHSSETRHWIVYPRLNQSGTQ
jgi:prepilin-type N-terminal cleavage/methylation domain-containing protein